jgi:hypothetical protein
MHRKNLPFKEGSFHTIKGNSYSRQYNSIFLMLDTNITIQKISLRKHVKRISLRKGAKRTIIL